MENNLSGSGSQSSSVSELEKRIFPRTRKAKRVRFFRNGDKFFSGITLPVLSERYRSFDSLIADLTRSLVENVTLPSGVRTVYTLDGRKVDKVDDLEDGQSYVCSGVGETFKKLDYEASAVTPQSFRLGPESVSRQVVGPCARSARIATTILLANPAVKQQCLHCCVSAWRVRQPVKLLALESNGVSSEGNGTPLSSRVRSCEPVMRSKLVTLIRNGTKPRKVCRLLLNKRNSPTLEQALAAITDSVKLDTGCVRKVFTQSGTPVTSLLQFFQDEDVFFAYGNERVNPEDFELDFEESKAVLQFKKSITRTPRKGPSPGMPLKESAAARAVRAAARAASVENPTTLESTFSVDSPIMPPALRLKYDVGAVIGEGYFAVVRICTDTTTDQKYALKIIDRRKSKGKEHYVAAEVRVMRNLCHPRVVTLYDEFYSTDWVFLVMELVRGGDLFDSIAASIKYSEPQSRLLIGHLTSAIAYLHSLSIVHRDIKPENLLVELAPDGSIRGLKLADFGLAVEVWQPLKTICGTPTYVAPEILLQVGYGLKIDVWAAGVILYVMLCGFPPFSAPNGDQEKLFDAILSGRLEFPLPFWQNVSSGAIDLIANMLRPQPELRFAAEDVLDHPWMADDYDSKYNEWYDGDSA